MELTHESILLSHTGYISLTHNIAATPKYIDLAEESDKATLGDCKALIPKCNADRSIRTYGFFLVGESFVLPAEPDIAREVLLERYQGWAHCLLNFI